LQTEVVAGLWEGFQQWLTTGLDESRQKLGNTPKPTATPPGRHPAGAETDSDEDHEDEDVWLAVATSEPDLAPSRPPSSPRQSHQALPPAAAAPRKPHHDPQTLATAHRAYLGALARRLLLTRPVFTDPLYELLVHIDRLVALVHRLHGLWTAADLEDDAGVVDAFVDLAREEAAVRRELRDVQDAVRAGVERVVGVLRTLEGDAAGDGRAPDAVADDAVVEGPEDPGDVDVREAGVYVPRRIGGLDRLLMKLDFGTWFDLGRRNRGEDDDDDDDDDI